MVTAENEIARRRRQACAVKTQHDPEQAQLARQDKFEVDFATLLANELLSSMNRYNKQASSYQSDVLLDREFNGYRVILIRRPGMLQPNTTLSPREQEIARMVAKGYPNKTIAAVLEISTWTVGTHLRRIFMKLGVNSRAAMVAQLSRLT